MSGDLADGFEIDAVLEQARYACMPCGMERNIERDKEVNSQLASEGWKVIRFWGKDITSNLSSCVDEVVALIEVKINN